MSSLEGSKRSTAVEHAIAGGVSQPFDYEALATSIGWSKERTSLLLNGVSFLAALSTSFEDISSGELIDKLSSHKMLENTSSEALPAWLSLLRAQADRFRSELENGELANAVLPSLQSFDIAIDIRLSNSTVASKPAAVPVAVAMLDTDSFNQTIWFQMSKQQLVKLHTQLGTALKQFERAEALASKA